METNNCRQVIIKSLYGKGDVVIDVSDRAIIYFANNGQGKSTVLRIFYYLLTKQYIKLLFEPFDAIEFTENGIIKSRFVNFINRHKESDVTGKRRIRLIRNWEMKMSRILVHGNEVDWEQRFYRDMEEELLGQVNISPDRSNKDSHEPTFNLSSEQDRKFPDIAEIFPIEDGQVPADSYEYYYNPMKDSRVLYLPTYRRIELDLQEEGWEITPIRDLSQRRYPEWMEREESLLRNLVQFGMQDVNERLQQLAAEIQKIALGSFQSMASNLLTQYAKQDNRRSMSENQEYDISQVKLVLNRIGDRIPSETKKEILSIVENENTDRSEYQTLFDVLHNLLEGYNDQQKLDNKIKGFVGVVNSYLEEKQFVFDESSLDVYVQISNDTGGDGRKLDLSDLSSGEKQIVSLFAKIYLSDLDGQIVIIDEPELSLSTEWQEKLLLDILRSDRCAFLLVATHSPFIVENREVLSYAAPLYS